MKLAISLGGSLLTRNLSTDNFRQYADALKYLKEREHRILVVCGGGKICRNYQRIAKELGAPDDILNRIGIQTTHLNAYTLIAGLGDYAYPYSARTIEEINKNIEDKIVVSGGLDYLLGPSTDYDTAFLAEKIEAELIVNATDIDGVYTKDPKRFPDAKKLDRLTYDQFKRIISVNEQSPLESRLFDIDAVDIIKRARIKTIIIDGRDAKEIIRAVDGNHNGTIIYDSI